MREYWRRITEMQEKQTAKGIKKYGHVLEESTVLTDPGETINYFQEEMIDALMYCEHLKSMINKVGGYAPGDVVWCIEYYDNKAMDISGFIFVAMNDSCIIVSSDPVCYDGSISQYLMDRTNEFDNPEVYAFPHAEVFATKQAAQEYVALKTSQQILDVFCTMTEEH